MRPGLGARTAKHLTGRQNVSSMQHLTEAPTTSTLLFIRERISQKRVPALPFVLAKVAFGGFKRSLPRQRVVTSKDHFHAAATAKETPVRRELDLPSFIEFGVVEHHPICDTAVSA